jgi:hypothetical protein
MSKQPLKERLQQLAGIKPLYEAEYGKYFGGRTRGGGAKEHKYEKVAFVYTEQGGLFYGLDVYVSKNQPQRSAKLKYDEANKWLKNTLEGGDDEEVEMLKTFGIEPSGPLKYSPEEEIIPRKYNSGMEDLDLIVDRLEELGIEASHGDYMDVS